MPHASSHVKIVADGFAPEVVVAIARGGLLPGGAIAYGLGAKNCGALNVEFYTGIGTVLDNPEVLPPALDMGYLKGRRVLLVDDVADSGRTLKLAVELLTAEGADVRSVTIYTKPSTVIYPDYAWKDDRRVDRLPVVGGEGSVIEEDANAATRSAWCVMCLLLFFPSTPGWGPPVGAGRPKQAPQRATRTRVPRDPPRLRATSRSGARCG